MKTFEWHIWPSQNLGLVIMNNNLKTSTMPYDIAWAQKPRSESNRDDQILTWVFMVYSRIANSWHWPPPVADSRPQSTGPPWELKQMRPRERVAYLYTVCFDRVFFISVFDTENGVLSSHEQLTLIPAIRPIDSSIPALSGPRSPFIDSPMNSLPIFGISEDRKPRPYLSHCDSIRFTSIINNTYLSILSHSVSDTCVHNTDTFIIYIVYWI